MNEQKIIMYDSPEAAKFVTGISGWVSSSGKFYGNDEHLARWSGCTHTKCNCGAIIPARSYTTCSDCRHKKASDEYLALQFKEYDGSPVVTWDGDTYFFTEEDIIEYLEDQETDEIDLLFCREVKYREVDSDYWADDLPEEGDIEPALQKALVDLNKVIKSLPPASYMPGNIRTRYKLTKPDISG